MPLIYAIDTGADNVKKSAVLPIIEMRILSLDIEDKLRKGKWGSKILLKRAEKGEDIEINTY